MWVERLLVAMALATWLALLAGTWSARQLLAQTPTGNRRTCPWTAKRSLFTHGLTQLQAWLGTTPLPHFLWRLADWDAPNWQQQLHAHHALAFIWAYHSQHV